MNEENQQQQATEDSNIVSEIKTIPSGKKKNRVTLTVTVFALLIVGIGITINSLSTRNIYNSHADITPSYSIYDGSLATDWKVHKNSDVSLSETQPLYTGNHSISFIARYVDERLDFHTNKGVQTNPYVLFHFAVYAIAPDEKFSVALVSNKTKFVPLSSNGGDPVQNKWKVYDIPLTSLQAINTNIKGVIIKSMTDEQPKIFISDIKLTALGNQSIQPTQLIVPTKKPIVSLQPTRVVTNPTTNPSIPVQQPGQGSLASFFSPSFTGKPFCLFTHQMSTISGTVLTVSYPAGSSAPSAGAPYGGAQICLPFTKGSGTDATLSYWVRFPIGFQFVKGGKLPGIYGGIEPFSGGGHNLNGWSMRLMWRPNGAGEVYGYISTTTGYGDEWGKGNFTWLADNQWHQVIEHVHLNTPGAADGYVTLSYNGKPVINQTGLAITTTNTKIGGLFFSTFYGGHNATWAPSIDEHIDFMGFTGNIQ